MGFLKNFLTDIADREFITFSKIFFNFDNLEDCHIKIAIYDLSGNIQEEKQNFEKDSDYSFWIYSGNMMIIWASMIFHQIGIVRDKELFFMMYETAGDFCGDPHYDLLKNLYPLHKKINTAELLKKSNLVVETKIHPQSKGMIVRSNTSLGNEIYLFFVLLDYLCKKYPNARQLLTDGLNMLISKSEVLEKGYLVSAMIMAKIIGDSDLQEKIQKELDGIGAQDKDIQF